MKLSVSAFHESFYKTSGQICRIIKKIDLFFPDFKLILALLGALLSLKVGSMGLGSIWINSVTY